MFVFDWLVFMFNCKLDVIITPLADTVFLFPIFCYSRRTFGSGFFKKRLSLVINKVIYFLYYDFRYKN